MKMDSVKNTLGSSPLTDTDIIDVERKGVKSLVFLHKLVEYLTSKFSFNSQWSGQFYDTTTQSSSINVEKAVSFNTTDWSNGISVINGTKITFEYAGRYNIQFSIQLAEIATGESQVSIWFRKNDSGSSGDIPNTCTDVHLTKTAGGGETFAAWNFAIDVESNDYIELIWSSTSQNTRLLYIAPRSSPTRPAVPSVILTVEQIP